jgi:hypothetical protein
MAMKLRGCGAGGGGFDIIGLLIFYFWNLFPDTDVKRLYQFLKKIFQLNERRANGVHQSAGWANWDQTFSEGSAD